MSLKAPEGTTIPFNSGNRSMRQEGEPTVAGRPSVGVQASTITWSPLSSPTILPFNGTDFKAVHLALRQAFGDFPIRVSRDSDARTLRGMAIGAGEGRTPYDNLVSALEQYGELELTCS